MFGLPIPAALVPWIARALVAVALLMVGYTLGSGATYRKWIASNETSATAAIKIVTKTGEVSTRIVTVYKDRQSAIQVVTQTIERKVTEYVDKASDAQCSVPVGFVRVHDAAAAGTIPGAAAGTDGQPSGVALSSVAATVATNYGADHLTEAKLKSLQEWARAQYKAVNGKELGY